MASRDELLAFAAEYLELDTYPDYGPMGLQVVGAEEVAKVACGVSASRDLFVGAAEAGAQLVPTTGSSGTRTRASSTASCAAA
jgi:putative NIF3 family GTP cyclohydrolase 1 type 2